MGRVVWSQGWRRFMALPHGAGPAPPPALQPRPGEKREPGRGVLASSSSFHPQPLTLLEVCSAVSPEPSGPAP